MPPPEVEKMKAEFSSMTGDPVKGAALAEKVLAKTIELSWGWVDDYFVFAIGKDHSHVKLASAADSVLHVPEVSSRAAAWQAKKPLSLGYVSQKTARALTEVFGGMTDTLISLVELGAGQSPIPLDGIIADLRKRYLPILPSDTTKFEIHLRTQPVIPGKIIPGKLKAVFFIRQIKEVLIEQLVVVLVDLVHPVTTDEYVRDRRLDMFWSGNVASVESSLCKCNNNRVHGIYYETSTERSVRLKKTVFVSPP